MDTRKRIFTILAALLAILLLLVVTQRREAGTGLRAAFDAEFLVRPDGYPGLSEHYGFSFSPPPRQMDPGLMYRAAADGAVDVIDAFATDGRIRAYDLLVLEDDRGFFPPYHAAPLVRRDTLEKHPEIGETLNRLAGLFDDETMQELNYRVDEQGLSARRVARDFLLARELIPAEAEQGNARDGRIAVGGKQFTEQEIIGEIMALMLEVHTGLRVDRRLNLGGTMICFNALRAGDLDLYPEYTGTGLVNILREEVIGDPDEALERVRERFEAEYGLAWLEPFGFNNTYTLTMRRSHAEELGLRTISDLAAQVHAGQSAAGGE